MRASRADNYFAGCKPWGPLEATPGDRVAYTRYWLTSVGAGPLDPLCRLWGTVLAIEGTWAHVVWDGRPEPVRVHLGNLAKPGPNLRFCE